MTLERVRQVLYDAEDIDPPPPQGTSDRLSETELDELLIHRWPMIVRRVMADGSDDWLKGFVRSIARHAKRASWRPTQKQQQIMRRLESELGTVPDQHVEMIER